MSPAWEADKQHCIFSYAVQLLHYITVPVLLCRSRTPGNRIVYLYTKKVGKAPKSACGICPGRLRGVSKPFVFWYMLFAFPSKLFLCAVTTIRLRSVWPTWGWSSLILPSINKSAVGRYGCFSQTFNLRKFCSCFS